MDRGTGQSGRQALLGVDAPRGQVDNRAGGIRQVPIGGSKGSHAVWVRWRAKAAAAGGSSTKVREESADAIYPGSASWR